MAENFDPGFFLDVASEAKFGFIIINRHAAWFLPQRLDFEDRKGRGGQEGQVFTFAVLIQRTQSGARSIAQRTKISRLFSMFSLSWSKLVTE